MERDAVCVSGTGLGGGGPGGLRNGGTSTVLGHSGVMLHPTSWLGVSFKVEILRV